MDKKYHVKQDEWRYTTTHKRSRKLVKRIRNKSKRILAKKLIQEELY